MGATDEAAEAKDADSAAIVPAKAAEPKLGLHLPAMKDDQVPEPKKITPLGNLHATLKKAPTPVKPAATIKPSPVIAEVKNDSISQTTSKA